MSEEMTIICNSISKQGQGLVIAGEHLALVTGVGVTGNNYG